MMDQQADSWTEIGYAKLNLALHVRGRRDDGYHNLDTLFAFVNDGDRLTAALADNDDLTVTGDFAEGLDDGADNLVMRAVHHARQHGYAVPQLSIQLEKNLPVAAGLGGGSADAAAILRLIHRLWPAAQSLDEMAKSAAVLGADVPACVLSTTQIGHGTGAMLHPFSGDVGCPYVLLVNPLVPVATGPVFAGWDGIDRGPMPTDSINAIVQSGRNDLEMAAIATCPEIADVLAVLMAQLPAVARMSGSGATCFALFSSQELMEAAADRIVNDNLDWWVMTGRLR